jgi:hypothetical protein
LRKPDLDQVTQCLSPQVAVWENGRVRQAGQIGLTADALRTFCDSLGAAARS